jgi:hypothetical protein
VKYRYDAAAPAKERETQRLAAENTWRAGRGLAPLPPPAPRPRPAEVPADVARPAIERAVAATDAEGRRAAASALEGLGLGVLPALVSALDALPSDHDARPDLETLGARLASVVTEVAMEKASLPADAAFSAVLDGVKGKPFRGETFVRLVTAALSGAPNGSVGIRLRAVREDDLSGVRVAVELVREPVRTGHAQLGTMGPTLRVGGRHGGIKSGATGVEYARKPDFWTDDAADVEKAFRSPPRVPVVLRFSAVAEE